MLCFHHDILYEAKIIALRLSDPEDRKSPYEYRVHYKGWKHTYVITFTLPASTQYGVRSIDSTTGADVQMFIPRWTGILEFLVYIWR